MKAGQESVLVTGLGAITSIGHGKENFWHGLLAGRSGVSTIESFDTAGMGTRIGGQVKDFVPSKYLSEDAVKNYGRASQLGAAAAKLAVADAELDTSVFKDKRVAVIIGTTMGESQVLESIDSQWIAGGEEGVAAAEVHKYPGNTIAINIASELEIDADCIVIPTACAAGNYAIGYGYDQIRSGKIDIAIVGGCDAFSRIALTGFSRLFAVAPEKCQPFDKNRKGIIVGEGAGILILESKSSAEKRHASSYAEVAGCAFTCDASHMTIPDELSIVGLMNKALKEANLSTDQIDYISAHGTGTKQNDKTESQAILKVFHSGQMPAVSSIKSMLGHTMGAASALEAIACVLAIHYSEIPPTINHETDDSECVIDCVPNASRRGKINVAMNNSYAFGGNNALTIFKACNI